MKKLPRTIVNPLIGDKVTFLKTAEETNGDYLLIEVELAPKGGNAFHYHTTFTEEFEVMAGTLCVQLEKQVMCLKPGEKAVVPLKKLHRFFNNNASQPCRFLVTIRPARQFEQTLRVAYGLACDGLMKPNGFTKDFWHLPLIFEMGESYMRLLPYRLQKWLSGILAKEARRRGKHKELEKYYLPQHTDEAVAA